MGRVRVRVRVKVRVRVWVKAGVRVEVRVLQRARRVAAGHAPPAQSAEVEADQPG